jgi:hypothetical protein
LSYILTKINSRKETKTNMARSGHNAGECKEPAVARLRDADSPAT